MTGNGAQDDVGREDPLGCAQDDGGGALRMTEVGKSLLTYKKPRVAFCNPRFQLKSKLCGN